MLLMMWMKHGRRALNCPESTFAFLDKNGHPFNESSFSEYWKKYVKETSEEFFDGAPNPTLLRSSFVDGYILDKDVDESSWEGASHLMGTSVRQWKDSYATKLHKRAIEKATKQHQLFKTNSLKSFRV